MDSVLGSDLRLQPARLATLVARSRVNIARSRSLLLAAEALMRAGAPTRWSRFAGGTDGPDAASPAASLAAADSRARRTRLKVTSGVLPTEGARHRWVGRGRGERCNGCGDPITPREIEFELDFKDALLLRLHAQCFKAWESFDGKRR
jgi:hypothetical protein